MTRADLFRAFAALTITPLLKHLPAAPTPLTEPTEAQLANQRLAARLYGRRVSVERLGIGAWPPPKPTHALNTNYLGANPQVFRRF